MELTLTISAEQASHLRDCAARLGVPIEQLASAAVADLIARGGEDFAAAAQHVLTKNVELYQRLR
jgi:hypothetical protein